MTRRNVAFNFALAGGLGLALALTATTEARAGCDYNGNGCDDHGSSDSNDDDRYGDDKHKPELGVGLDLLHTTYGMDSLAGGMFGLRTSMHARLGRRIALGVGMEEGFGTDKSGFRRYDLAWTLPDLYVYLTPGSKLQLYSVLGLDMRVSHFESAPDHKLPEGLPWGHFYMGGTMGMGVESRMSKTSAIR
ncbi:MAG: hypothetical protein ABI175_10870, partial [Polyangiales bacterium]